MEVKHWFAANRPFFTEENIVERLFSLAEHYHENSKYYPDLFAIQSPKFFEHPLEQKAYDEHEQIQLPSLSALQLNEVPIGDVLKSRRSAREFGEPLTVNELATVLQYSCGVNSIVEVPTTRGKTDYHLRTYPSGGAIYSVHTYIYVNDVSDLDNGLYFFDPVNNRLSLIEKRILSSKDIRRLFFFDRLKETAEEKNYFQQAGVYIFFTTSFVELEKSYGLRAYRMLLKETGHIAQNFLLVTTAMNLNSVPVEGFYDDNVNEFLNIDGVNESVVYSLLIGKNN